MKKIRIRNGNSNWVGSLDEVLKWARETCFNDFQRRRQEAARKWLNVPVLDKSNLL